MVLRTLSLTLPSPISSTTLGGGKTPLEGGLTYHPPSHALLPYLARLPSRSKHTQQRKFRPSSRKWGCGRMYMWEKEGGKKIEHSSFDILVHPIPHPPNTFPPPPFFRPKRTNICGTSPIIFPLPLPLLEDTLSTSLSTSHSTSHSTSLRGLTFV